jgi:hypothetical protein
MNRHVLVFLLIDLLNSLAGYSQNRNNIWCFGDSSGIDFGNGTTPTTFRTSVVSRGSCVSIADSLGSLLFYAHTRAGASTSGTSTYVFDHNHNLMPNGTNIKGESWFNELIIIPNPGTSQEYFLFTKGTSTSPGLAYSKIDMSLNGGLGDISQKNIFINNVRNADCLTAIKHGNGYDWWLISKYSNLNMPNFNRFYVFLLTNNTIHPPIIQDLNNSGDFDLHQLVFSSNGSKLMQTTTAGLMQEIDFDRCSGLLTNPKVIFPEQLTLPYTRFHFSTAYSADDTKLYVTTALYNVSFNDTTRLIQYDLNAFDIPASADTLLEEKYPTQIGAVKLAPDGKVYVTTYHYFGFPGYPYPDTSYNQFVTNLSVINYPDSIGASCDFQPYSFNLGGSRTYYGLPNNPNYDLGPLVGSGCDTITAITETQYVPATSLYVYHDSKWEIAFVNAKDLKGKFGVISIYDLQGKLVHQSPIPINNGTCTIDVSTHSFSKGIHLIQIFTEKETMSRKFLVE